MAGFQSKEFKEQNQNSEEWGQYWFENGSYYVPLGSRRSRLCLYTALQAFHVLPTASHVQGLPCLTHDINIKTEFVRQSGQALLPNGIVMQEFVEVFAFEIMRDYECVSRVFKGLVCGAFYASSSTRGSGVPLHRWISFQASLILLASVQDECNLLRSNDACCN